ncbi:MAG TPA: sigma-70 family RNA polymerase sigma factor [Phycisphaerales bacterium]|nr:sigma-70 family RNA polymerase sigma factor [Phycisphaerales bacterium]HRQ75664.1 sigma-70 family RNA polymerase sigma factor [Phycisphaerales bacterium]
MEHLPDEILLSNFRGGDGAALAELARRCERSLLGVALGLLGRDRESARDAVQETWLRVIRYAGGFRQASAFRTWLYRILVNQCRTIGQKKRRILRQMLWAHSVNEAPKRRRRLRRP